MYGLLETKPSDKAVLENLIMQAKLLERPNTALAWGSLKQAVFPDSIVLRVNQRSIEGVYVEIFARDSIGKRIYFSGLGNMSKDICHWWQGEKVYLPNGQRNPELTSCEIPIRQNVDVDLIKQNLISRGLLPTTDFAYDLQYAWTKCNRNNFGTPGSHYLAYMKLLEKLGYKIFPIFFEILHKRYLISEEITSFEMLSQQRTDIPLYSEYMKFCKAHLRPPSINPQLDKIYILPGLECAATAKTIFNITGFNHVTLHCLPIGPIEAISSIAKHGLADLAKISNNFSSVPEALKTNLNNLGIDCPLKQHIALLIWRLELKVYAAKGGFIRNMLPNSTVKQLAVLTDVFFPFSNLVRMSHSEIIEQLSKLAVHTQFNHTLEWQPDFTRTQFESLIKANSNSAVLECKM